MKFILAVALLAQIAFVFGQNPYNQPNNFQFFVPRPSFKAFYPYGFRMSIPDWPGIESVTFNVKTGTTFQAYPAQRSYWSTRWSIWDNKTPLQPGNTVEFNVVVKKNGQEYKYENGRIFVTGHAYSSEESFESLGSSEEYLGHYNYWQWNNQIQPQGAPQPVATQPAQPPKTT